MAAEDYQGPIPNGWTGGTAITKWWRGVFIHLYKLHKPCAQCGRPMSIDVTKAALEGKAKNAGLQLKRCVDCREATRGLTSSRPKAHGELPPQAAPFPGTAGELEQLRTANATMKEELEGLYATVRELQQRLSKYELTETALENAMVEIGANGPLFNRVGKMPWES